MWFTFVEGVKLLQPNLQLNQIIQDNQCFSRRSKHCTLKILNASSVLGMKMKEQR